jgi:pyruvate,water dikinase
LGGLPLIKWITYGLTGQHLDRLGTGNVSVSAAFYHGGRLVGGLAVLSEALKGVLAVLLARYYFPQEPAWEIVALIMLVIGRYWFGNGAGATNVTWGYLVHAPLSAVLVFLIGGISFTLLRERRLGRIAVLVLFPLITALRYPQKTDLIGATILLAALLGWIYTKIPDDLEQPSASAQKDTQRIYRFFQGNRSVLTLNQILKAQLVGEKAAKLSELRQLGYPVPMGWVLVPGDDPEPLLAELDPSPKQPLIVRSSAIGEDSMTASAAGQYESVANVTRKQELPIAIARCFGSYQRPAAVTYRQEKGLSDGAMSVLIQPQIRGVFSGVAFSRDPIQRQGNSVSIEALSGNASRVVSGTTTPERYEVLVEDQVINPVSWQLPETQTLSVQGTGEVPERLIQQVAYLARHIEQHYQGVPQDIEWSYDGKSLWLLQARPVTTLLPIWTRKIAAEVIPGVIRPLTWSVNRPLTCGVWGDLFTLVLGDRTADLDFNQTATLHYARAYFNATLLADIFQRMGLPPESLEFLTRGAKFSRPSWQSMLKNAPGLFRLLKREWYLERDFHRDDRTRFAPILTSLAATPAAEQTPEQLLERIDDILATLKSATYYSILAPLSAALRKAVLSVQDEDLDYQATPEVAAARSLQELARSATQLLNQQASRSADSKLDLSAEDLFATLATQPKGQAILLRLERLIQDYAYLSDVGTDIAVPTWGEQPQLVRELFAQFCLTPPPIRRTALLSRHVQRVQRRFDLKGRVTEIYSRLLAELRWSFIALEQHWCRAGILADEGDVFFLELEEIRGLIQTSNENTKETLLARIQYRRNQFAENSTLETVPFLVYGNDPPVPSRPFSTTTESQYLQGIAASPGQVEGKIKVVRALAAGLEVDRTTILVVPYTDSGWVPLLARAGGLISEVGGRLSHGAIVAREYGIPAVMDVPDATQRLQDDQRVRLDGSQGTVELL